jgi:signal peptidase I
VQPIPALDAAPVPVPRPELHQRGVLRFLREILETVILVVAIYALVNLASARFVVEGDSMQPNFHSGQFVIVDRVSYMVSQPQRGDIVVFHFPGDVTQDYIKRVIGLPGQTVEIKDTRVFVNGQQLNEPYINEPCNTTRCYDHSWTLQPDEFFVMGDNRNHSDDSRIFGPVKRNLIVGEALLRYWPPSDWGIVRQIRFNGAANTTTAPAATPASTSVVQ